MLLIATVAAAVASAARAARAGRVSRVTTRHHSLPTTTFRYSPPPSQQQQQILPRQEERAREMTTAATSSSSHSSPFSPFPLPSLPPLPPSPAFRTATDSADSAGAWDDDGSDLTVITLADADVPDIVDDDTSASSSSTPSSSSVSIASDSAGEGMVIGIVDTGIWPEHPSFSDPVSGGQAGVRNGLQWSELLPLSQPPSPNPPGGGEAGVSLPPPPNSPRPPLSPPSPRPTSPTAAPQAVARQAYKPYSRPPRRWRGRCERRADFSACNRKVIGARFFSKGFKRNVGAISSSADYLSARDADEQQQATGVCSMRQARVIHMATPVELPLPSSPHSNSPPNPSPPFLTTFRAAAGNGHVQYAAGTGYSYGNTSGMAPRARLAIYKVLWKQRDGQTLATYSDIRAAVDAAVSDGVDVLSISLGGNVPSYFSDIAYLNAAKAGVFIAMAAGNSGRPNPKKLVGTIGNASPFYLTVGASSISRYYNLQMTLGDGSQITGVGTTPPPVGTNGAVSLIGSGTGSGGVGGGGTGGGGESSVSCSSGSDTDVAGAADVGGTDGQAATYVVTISSLKPVAAFRFGSITWKDQYGHNVRSPLVVRSALV
ncbi:unnamed protein product [Closterium sp. Naga37s-1]|nr:unnamed protein product [Closterium sp. Naga37s-1]